LIRLTLAALVAIAACPPAAQRGETVAATSATLDVPAYVVDSADMLAPPAEQALAQRLRDFERRTRHQLVLVTVPTTAGRDIADYTRDLGNRWGIGRRGHDDGIILLFARDDRKVRIAVGNGLSPRFPDAAAEEIIRTRIVPLMAAGDHRGGIESGAAAIIARLAP
jgi:uncharacterized protein